MDDKIIVQLEHLKILPNRQKVLRSLQDEDYMRPTQIAEKTNLHHNTVSNNLKKLRNNGYVYVINPEYHVPRLYRLTDNGKKILDLLDQYE